jgi:hypothetical protein
MQEYVRKKRIAQYTMLVQEYPLEWQDQRVAAHGAGERRRAAKGLEYESLQPDFDNVARVQRR